MNRRKYIKTIAAAGASSAVPSQAAAHSIQLHVDLDVEPTKEKDLVGNFHKIFHPVIAKQPGFVEVKLLKLRSTMAGPAPVNAPYRLLIGFQTEEQRKAWIATADHQKVWPSIEKNLRGAKIAVFLYDVA